VEFDSWHQNAEDLNSSHIAVIKNSTLIPHYRRVDTTVAPLSTHFRTASIFYIRVEYIGPSRNLRVFANVGAAIPAGATPIINHIFSSSLTAMLGGLTLANFGFTASTGAAWEAHNLRSWKLETGAPPATVQALSNKFKVYYPHAYDPASSKYGETLDAFPLPMGLCDGAAVNYYSRKDKKFYLYYIGGGTGEGNTVDPLLYKYDFDNPAVWSPLDPGDDNWTQKTGVAACAWGDEIFIFGGASGTVKDTGIAYNPDTNRYRTLTNLPATRTYQSAVPVGPYIYLLGGATAVSGTGNGITTIYRYKP